MKSMAAGIQGLLVLLVLPMITLNGFRISYPAA
jgi:hypothetical protein